MGNVFEMPKLSMSLCLSTVHNTRDLLQIFSAAQSSLLVSTGHHRSGQEQQKAHHPLRDLPLSKLTQVSFSENRPRSEII